MALYQQTALLLRHLETCCPLSLSLLCFSLRCIFPPHLQLLCWEVCMQPFTTSSRKEMKTYNRIGVKTKPRIHYYEIYSIFLMILSSEPWPWFSTISETR